MRRASHGLLGLRDRENRGTGCAPGFVKMFPYSSIRTGIQLQLKSFLGWGHSRKAASSSRPVEFAPRRLWRLGGQSRSEQ